MNDVLRGVLFSLAGNISISIGDHLKVFGDQKSNTNKKFNHGSKKQTKINKCSARLFFGLLGYIVMITGQCCNGYALAFAPQTLLVSIGSVQFIMNLICSAILMSRPIKSIHIIGTFSIIMGCLLMIFGFSPKTDQSQLTVYTLFYNFNSMHYRNYLIIVVIVFLLSIIWQYFETNYLNFNNSLNVDNLNHHSPKTIKKKQQKRRHKNNNKTGKTAQQSTFCCIDPKLISGFFYSFSSAMTGTQSVVLGKTLAIIIRNYASGKITIFNPLDLFNLFFIIIIFLSYLITFAFWLYRRTESMVLFDTVFIAPMNQVMWLTFSTVAGGIYFHEFENAHTFQWIALILGMMLNYFGLYHLVPTASDQPILIINMDKPLKKKVDDDDEEEEIEQSNNNNNNNHDIPTLDCNQNSHNKRKQVQINTEHNIKDIDYGSDSATAKQKHRKMKKNIVIKFNKSYKFDNELKVNMAPTDSESIESIDTLLSGDDYQDEQVPLLQTTSTINDNATNEDSWYQRFVAKNR